MYCVLAEHQSDVGTLKVLMRRIVGANITVKGKGFDGGGDLLCKGARVIDMFARAPFNCRRFVICYDADGSAPAERYEQIRAKVVVPARIGTSVCVIIPVQAIESWILADLAKVTQVIKGWRPTQTYGSPEGEPNPKDALIRLSKSSNQKPRYDHTVHNELVAEHLDLDVVAQKCPSFAPLWSFARMGMTNCP